MRIDGAGTAGRLAQGGCRARSVPWLASPLLAVGAVAEAADDVGRAKAGDPAAQLALAVRLEAKGGDQADEAILWYARAAARGEARAQYYLGQIFETGQGVDRNPALARAWYAAAGKRSPPRSVDWRRWRCRPRRRRRRRQGSSGPRSARKPRAWCSISSGRARRSRTARASMSTCAPGRTRATPSDRSAIAVPLPPGWKPACVRVVALDPEGGRYAASAWICSIPTPGCRRSTARRFASSPGARTCSRRHRGRSRRHRDRRADPSGAGRQLGRQPGPLPLGRGPQGRGSPGRAVAEHVRGREGAHRRRGAPAPVGWTSYCRAAPTAERRAFSSRFARRPSAGTACSPPAPPWLGALGRPFALRRDARELIGGVHPVERAFRHRPARRDGGDVDLAPFRMAGVRDCLKREAIR